MTQTAITFAPHPFSLRIVDAHGERIEPYPSSEAAKRAAQVLLEQSAIEVEFRLHGSGLWTRYGKRG